MLTCPSQLFGFGCQCMNELFVHCMHDWRQLCSRIPETGPGLRGGCRRVLLKEAAPSMGNLPTDVTDRRYRQTLQTETGV